jgi:hypothetical protein
LSGGIGILKKPTGIERDRVTPDLCEDFLLAIFGFTYSALTCELLFNLSEARTTSRCNAEARLLGLKVISFLNGTISWLLPVV